MSQNKKINKLAAKCRNTVYSPERIKHYARVKHNIFKIYIAVLILLTSCASPPVTRIAYPYKPEKLNLNWKSICSGIEIADIYDKNLPLIGHIVKIDLQNPDISVITSEPALFKNNEGLIRAETTYNFAKRHNTVVAFNAAAFQTSSRLSYLFDSHRKILGIHIAEGKQMSPVNESLAAILFFDKGKAEIISRQTERAVPENTVCAVSGFSVILRNKQIVKSSVNVRDSRMAVGLANGGLTLFVLSVEAENTYKSQGLTYDETALLMLELGAEDAMQLDGGGSSTLIINEKGKQRIAAPTIGPLILRRVASNVGIIYKHLQK
ncbi:phosphodiester glycosidase family protein [Treponema pedis]|uniref:Phosphodiester glycosidase family protein n=1 Tax=Treponema pedis TaxID=409322 RepID=A0A7S6WPX4_9SPIR|nr:phosphodiester glycosidase family protein [Treponema pedis]QOW60572.1 phosphodiester glycosidase family protein [Treponema pedis]QSI03843.1 phosphodiester glycosidase family protein [Treponema pedis]